MIDLLPQENYLLPSLLGKWSTHREDAARAAIKIFQHEGKAKEFLCGVIEQEVLATIDPNTIFRGNSMGSKALDVYMKLAAQPFLRKVLTPIVREIITSKKSCEVDPTRLEKGDDLAKNLKQLIAMCDMAFGAIMKASSECPRVLCEAFGFLRKSVKARFPTDPYVEYTSVSGFIFLRFFCAAILGPTLFGLWAEQVEKNQARALTLVAKTIQNLGNLAEFGYKEAYMKDMNQFITQRLDDLKKYIDDISV
jgi:hypothetical protein